MLWLLFLPQPGHGTSMLVESSMLFMGASFRLQLVREKPNCARLDAPTTNTTTAAGQGA